MTRLPGRCTANARPVASALAVSTRRRARGTPSPRAARCSPAPQVAAALCGTQDVGGIAQTTRAVGRLRALTSQRTRRRPRRRARARAHERAELPRRRSGRLAGSKPVAWSCSVRGASTWSVRAFQLAWADEARRAHRMRHPCSWRPRPQHSLASAALHESGATSDVASRRQRARARLRWGSGAGSRGVGAPQGTAEAKVAKWPNPNQPGQHGASRVSPW